MALCCGQTDHACGEDRVPASTSTTTKTRTKAMTTATTTTTMATATTTTIASATTTATTTTSTSTSASPLLRPSSPSSALRRPSPKMDRNRISRNYNRVTDNAGRDLNNVIKIDRKTKTALSFRDCCALLVRRQRARINRTLSGWSSSSPPSPSTKRALVIRKFSKLFFVIWLFACSSLLQWYGGVHGEPRPSSTGSDQSSSSSSSSSSATFAQGCPNCQISHELIRRYMLDEIKQTILSKLGFTEVPNITNRIPSADNPLIRQLMSNVSLERGHLLRHNKNNHQYDIQNDESQKQDDDDDRLRNMRLASVAKPCEQNCRRYKNRNPLTFTFEQKVMQSKLVSAKLSFYQKQVLLTKISESEPKVNITILKYNRESSRYVTFLTTEEKLSTSNRWIEIDIGEPLSKHFKDNNSLNLILVINVSPHHMEITSKLVTDVKSDEESGYAPFVEIQTEELHNKRSKRSNYQDCKADEKSQTCCRYPMIVNFDEINWDFIIAPRKYEAFYCAGECQMLSNQKYPHSQLAYITRPNNKPMLPCCSPRKMSAMSMIYIGQQGNIHFGVLPGMVVERCGCV